MTSRGSPAGRKSIVEIEAKLVSEASSDFRIVVPSLSGGFVVDDTQALGSYLGMKKASVQRLLDFWTSTI